jgi:hypothetical protein
MHKVGCPVPCLLALVLFIGLMAYILLPIFASAVHQAKESRCQYNLLAIGRAFEMYRQDWGDCYPVAHNLHNDAYTWEPAGYHRNTAEPFWWEVLRPYLRTREMVDQHGVLGTPLRCPLDRGTGMSFDRGYESMYDYWKDKLKEPPYNRTNGLSCSYVWNGALGWKDLWQLSNGKNVRPRGNCHYRTLPEDGGGPSPKGQNMISQPGVRYLCWDWIGGWHRVREPARKGYAAGWTVLYCDTHVKWIGYEEFDEACQLPDKEAVSAWWTPVESDRAP